MNRTAIYPGSFDPITYGHLDLIKRAASLFDKLIVAVADNTHKKPLFNRKERVQLVKDSIENFEGNIEIVPFDGLIVEFARNRHVNILLRGLRVISDFDYELRMALINRRLDDKIETLFLMPSEGLSFLSSSLIKEATLLGADISSFVPPVVAEQLKKKLLAKKK